MAGPIRASSSFPLNAGTFRRDGVGNSRAGCCTLCRSAKATPVKPCVELGPNSQPFREGMVVLCFNCASSVGQAIGMLPQVREVALVGEVEVLRAEVARLSGEVEVFASMRDALDRLTAGSRGAGS